uniref:Uncharacterized protein n=1 Tax=Romanomermis culicivorax TaxID=13658 RepID=A0A915HIS8_ROMCU
MLMKIGHFNGMVASLIDEKEEGQTANSEPINKTGDDLALIDHALDGLKQLCNDQNWPNLAICQTTNIRRGVFTLARIAKGTIAANYNGDLMKIGHFNQMIPSLVEEKEK